MTLTGSERAGRSVAELAGKHLKKCVLELGGSDPFIVAALGRPRRSPVPLAVTARIQNNGQACIASKRFIVVRERADEFLERYAAAMARGAASATPWTPRPCSDRSSRGPARRAGRAGGDVDRARAPRRSPAAHAPERRGFYYPATVLTDVPSDSRAGCEELFGPVAVVARRPTTSPTRFASPTPRPGDSAASIWATDDAEIDAGDRRARRRHGLCQRHRRLDERAALRRHEELGLWS